MKVKALKSFSGLLTMHTGEVKDIEEEEVLTDLLQACYVEEVKTDIAKKVVTKNESKRTTK